MTLPSQKQPERLFWRLKWHIREELLHQYGGYELNLVQLSEERVRHFISVLVAEASNLDPIVLDMLVNEAVKESFTYRPLIKATVLSKESASS